MAQLRYETVLGDTPQFDFGNPRSANWTEFDADLTNCAYPAHAVQAIRDTRLAFANSDMPRSRYWSVPDDIDMVTDIPYLDDDVRGHRLDLYLPHDAVVRGGHALPVYVDIHGGGFVYGYKELNRNFNVTLARHGFAVFSLNYQPAPQTDFIGQLQDIAAGLTWIAQHGDAYPIDLRHCFITGDSAGGTLAFYQAVLQNNPWAARAYDITPSGLSINGIATISGLFDLSPFTPGVPHPHYGDERPDDVVSVIGPQFFKRLAGIDPDVRFSTDLIRNCAIPPVYLATSSDDFIEAETLALATSLSHAHKDFELHDVKVRPGTSLGHVYSVCMSWLDESKEVFRQIHDFSYRLIR